MINKEIFFNGDGTIYKDFDNRNIPQYQHNTVSVNVCIPKSLLDIYPTASVELAAQKIPKDEEEPTQMYNLFASASKTIWFDNIQFVKYSAILPYDYTNFIGSLRIAFVLKEIVQSSDEFITTTIQTSNYATLNVIKSVVSNVDETVETSVVEELENAIASKHIKSIDIYNNANEQGLVYGLASEYAFNGWVLQVKWNNAWELFVPTNISDVISLLRIGNDGKVYRYTDITETSYTKIPLTLTKNEIGSLYVAKTTLIANCQIGTGISKEELKSALDINDIEQDVADIISGDIVVKESEKATKDAQGNVIASTYAKISESGYSLSFTMDNDFVITVALKDKNNNTLSSGSIDLPIEDVGVVDMEYNPTTKKLILTLKNGRTIEVEVSEILTNVVQYQDIADNLTTESQYKVLSAKQGKILKGYADELDARVSQIESTGSAVATLDNVVLDTDNWQETTTYPSFSYKYVITNQVFVGCISVHLVLGVEDADSGNFASSVDIDKVNGKITLYARELPSEDITIPTILVYTGQNSYSGLDARIGVAETKVAQLETRMSEVENEQERISSFLLENSANIESIPTLSSQIGGVQDSLVAFEFEAYQQLQLVSARYIHNLSITFHHTNSGTTDRYYHLIFSVKSTSENEITSLSDALSLLPNGKVIKCSGWCFESEKEPIYAIKGHQTNNAKVVMYSPNQQQYEETLIPSSTTPLDVVITDYVEQV